jgi:hypothetical protein
MNLIFTNVFVQTALVLISEKTESGSKFWPSFEKGLVDQCDLNEPHLKDGSLARMIAGLSVMAWAESEVGGDSTRAVCDEWGISEDQAYRLKKYVRNEVVFKRIDTWKWRSAEWEVEVLFESDPVICIRKVEGDDSEIKYNFEEDGDDAYLSATWASQIRTIPQLLEACEVDLTEWEPHDAVLNKWPMGYTTGSAENREGKTIDLFQVKVKLKRIKITTRKFPTIKPARVEAAAHTFVRPDRQDRVALIVPDPQIGFRRDLRTGKLEALHDRAAMSIVLQIANRVQPDELVILGDWLDLASWSLKFLRSPEFAQTTNPALAEGAWWLSHLRQTCDVAHFLEGNHEKRVQDSVITHLEEAYDLTKQGNIDDIPLLSMSNLLGLQEMDYKICAPYPHGEVWLNDNIRIAHGEVVRGESGATTSAVVKTAMTTEIFGHIHRVELATKTKHHRGSAYPIHAFSPGCLCRLDSSVPAAKSRNNWQHGCGVVHYDSDSNWHSITPISIHAGMAAYNGEMFKAKNLESYLSSETGWDLTSDPNVYMPTYHG